MFSPKVVKSSAFAYLFSALMAAPCFTSCDKQGRTEVPADTPVKIAVDTTETDSVVAKVDSIALKIEEFKKFRTNDLSAFLLHGSVKTLTETSGSTTSRYSFSEKGC